MFLSAEIKYITIISLLDIFHCTQGQEFHLEQVIFFLIVSSPSWPQAFKRANVWRHAKKWQLALIGNILTANNLS